MMPETGSARSTSLHFHVLDGLRGVAAVLVVLLHVLEPFELHAQVVPYAGLAVDFFFCLSGFVMAHAYQRKLIAGMPFAHFLKLRIARLFPMILIGCLLGLVVWTAQIAIRHRADLLGPVLVSFALNIFLVPSPLLLADAHNAAWPMNMPMWSLFYEVLANAAFGVLLFRLRHRSLVMLSCVAGAAVFYAGVATGFVGGGSRWGEWLLGILRVAYPFLAGLLVHRMVLGSAGQEAGRSKAGWHWSVSVVLLLMVCMAPVVAPFRGYWELAAVIALLPMTLVCGAKSNAKDASLRLMKYLGELSYPLYLTHYPVVVACSFVIRKVAEGNTPLLYGLLGLELLVIVMFSAVIVRVELQLRTRLETSLLRTLTTPRSLAGRDP